MYIRHYLDFVSAVFLFLCARIFNRSVDCYRICVILLLFILWRRDKAIIHNFLIA